MTTNPGLTVESLRQAAPATRTQKVVIVNGSAEILDLLETVLDAGHYDVVFVESSSHAYSQIKRVQPNLVVLCAQIEDPESFQVLSMLKLDDETSQIPVLTYTTNVIFRCPGLEKLHDKKPVLDALARHLGVLPPFKTGPHEDEELDQGEWSDDVHAVDALERVERVLGKRRLGAGTEQARVVHQEVDAIAGRIHERAAVIGIGDVAGDRRHTLEAGGGPRECIGVARFVRTCTARSENVIGASPGGTDRHFCEPE